MRETWGRIIGGGVLLLALAALPWLPPVERTELRTQDLRFAIRGPRPPHAKIVIIQVDDATGRAWPEPTVSWGPHLAILMQKTLDDGAQVIGLDMTPAVDTDGYLQNVTEHTLKSAGKSSASILRWEGKTADDPLLHPNDTLLQFLQDNPSHVILAEAGVGSVDKGFVESGVRMGDASLPTQADGSVRHLTIGPSSVPTMIGAVAQAAGKTVPPGDFGINFATLQPGQTFPTFRATDVISGRLTAAQRAEIKGSIVLIGEDMIRDKDIQSVPGGSQFTGTEILAQGLATVLDGDALRRPSRWAESAITLVAALLSLLAWSGLGSKRPRFVYGLLALLLIAAAYLGGVQAAFNHAFFLLPVTAPLVGLIVPFALAHLRASLAERRLRRQIEETFVRYAGPRVRDYLLESARNQDLGGRVVVATVLFFDLRGSTTYAATRSADTVMTELNTLFARIIPPVLEAGGLIIRYTGDGFLAVFGAPQPQADHAGAALAAVREVTERMVQDQSWKCGMGVHTGSLLFGNLGSLDRLELTVIGDTVNVAARLQEATKEFGCSLVISEATYRAAGCPSGFTGPVSCPVRGRPDALHIYLLESNSVSNNEGEIP